VAFNYICLLEVASKHPFTNQSNNETFNVVKINIFV